MSGVTSSSRTWAALLLALGCAGGGATDDAVVAAPVESESAVHGAASAAPQQVAPGQDAEGPAASSVGGDVPPAEVAADSASAAPNAPATTPEESPAATPEAPVEDAVGQPAAAAEDPFLRAVWRALASGPLVSDPSASRARTVGLPTLLPGRRPGLVRPPVDRAAARDASLALRASRRAFEGAPPVMPHSLDYGGTMPCLTCHESGVVIGEAVARPMSHGPMGACTQCHVSRRDRAFDELTPFLESGSDFVGRGPPGPGARAFDGAPPRVPHAVQLRGRCTSCHGEHGYPGVRTSHPLRGHCVQCHVVPSNQQPLAPTFDG